METTILVANIILAMRQYQKENNVKNQCVTNAQYLYDLIKMNTSINVKTKAVIVISNNFDESISMCVTRHLVLVLDDDILLDPSYDVFCLKNKVYFDNINDFFKALDNESKSKILTEMGMKEVVEHHISFCKISERINNGKFIITEKEHYNKQADYIERIYF